MIYMIGCPAYTQAFTLMRFAQLREEVMRLFGTMLLLLGLDQFLPTMISNLYQCFCCQSWYVVSILSEQGLTKSGEDYANKSAHVELAERMCKVTFCPKCVEIRVVWCHDHLTKDRARVCKRSSMLQLQRTRFLYGENHSSDTESWYGWVFFVCCIFNLEFYPCS
jgi:hypothetical protein